MHNPAHPGEIVREECLKPLKLSVTAAAEAHRDRRLVGGERRGEQIARHRHLLR
jgi:plasmid maintenance system antidote protein VapI